MLQEQQQNKVGRPKSATKDSSGLEQEMKEWSLEQVKKFLMSNKNQCKGNMSCANQRVIDALTCAFLHDGLPPPGKKSAFMRVTGFSKGMLERAEKLRSRKSITPEQLSKPNRKFYLSRKPQSSGPKKKRERRWVYEWFHDHEKNPMIYVDKSRPEHYKGLRIKIKIDGVIIPVTCQRHFMTGHKKDMAQSFLASAEYKEWQKQNPGDKIPLRQVEKCICPCMRPAQVKECACPTCTEMQAALIAWNTQRRKWQKEATCGCSGCSDPCRFAAFNRASTGLNEFRDVCLCSKIEFPGL